jgi:exonuclease III
MMGITTYLSILTLNVNGLNSPMKRHCLANRIRNEDPTNCCRQDQSHLQKQALAEGERLEKICQANGSPKQAGVAILISK